MLLQELTIFRIHLSGCVVLFFFYLFQTLVVYTNLCERK